MVSRHLLHPSLRECDTHVTIRCWADPQQGLCFELTESEVGQDGLFVHEFTIPWNMPATGMGRLAQDLNNAALHEPLATIRPFFAATAGWVYDEWR